MAISPMGEFPSPAGEGASQWSMEWPFCTDWPSYLLPKWRSRLAKMGNVRWILSLESFVPFDEQVWTCTIKRVSYSFWKTLAYRNNDNAVCRRLGKLEWGLLPALVCKLHNGAGWHGQNARFLANWRVDRKFACRPVDVGRLRMQPND